MSEATLALRKVRLITAVKTPYLPDGKVDLEAYEKIVEHQIANGVEGLIAKFGGRILIVGNTGSNHTAEAVWATEKGFAAGMDASLLINPYYGKTSDSGIIMHLEAALKFGPAFIYNVPGRTGQDSQTNFQLHAECVLLDEIFIRTSSPA
eukprot:s923_g4.t1